MILGMIMQDMSGGDTCDRLKEINPKVKVLLSSGYSINGQATEIMDRGCDGFIQKPFKIKELSQKLREILDSCISSINRGKCSASDELSRLRICVSDTCWADFPVILKQ